jgi:alpha-tubulin suppressor-like RCC1 family protein
MKRFLLSLYLIVALLSANAQCWQQVAAGLDHTLAIKPDGTLWGWGGNFVGQLGVGTVSESVQTPVQIGTDNDWKEVSAGGNNSMAVKNDGTLWAWGSNQFGQIGDGLFGVENNVISPKKIGTATNWKTISAGSSYSMAIRTDGTLWGWGGNLFGQLGTSGGNPFVPTQVGTDTNWKMVSASVMHTFAIKTDGSLWGWGSNSFFQLGNESIGSSSVPVRLGPAVTWQSISTGYNFTMGITTDGKRWNCGYNDYGQLGNGSFLESYDLMNVDPTVTWKAIAVGYNHVTGIKSDGTLWTWGFKIGTFDDKSNVPVQVGSDTNWESLSAGDYHTFAFKTDGSLWGWGQGEYDKLGNGSWVDVTQPQNIGGGTPTGETMQSFCGSATIADLHVTSGTNVQWYAQATGGSALATNTVLVNNGHYYASQTIAGCESLVRFHVMASVSAVPSAPTGFDAQNFCPGTALSAVEVEGTNIKWYAAASGGSPLTPGTVLVNNTHYFASQTVNGCESAARFEVTVALNNTATPTGTASQTVCFNSTISNLSATGTNIKWYSAPTGGSPLAVGTVVVDQQYYYASQTVSSLESCTRLAVKANVTSNTPPTGGTYYEFCFPATVASLYLESGTNIKWYTTASGGSPLSSSTLLVHGTHYYASQTIGSCETTARLEAFVLVNLTPKPLGDEFQHHCLNSTVADLTVSGSNIKWYATLFDTTPLDPSTALVNGGIYYATATEGTQESCDRLEVWVTVEDIPIPYGEPIQTFCDAATPGDLIVAVDYGGDIKWYATPSGGSPLASNAALIHNTPYYASQSAFGCESINRFEVVVDLNTTPTPTPTGSPTLETCGGTIYQLPATGSNIQWYASPTGGEPLLTTDFLENNTHYYATQTVNTCESTGRLDVLVTVKPTPSLPVVAGSEEWLTYSISSDNFVMAIKPDGSLWGWGKNTNGQLGIVTTEPPYQPTLISSTLGWKEVAAGGEFSLALKADGTLWRLDFGGTLQQVGTAADWSAISTGGMHALILKTNGTLWAVGKNEYGQLGDGTTTARTLPVRIGTDANWTLIAAGSVHSLARKADGTIWAWGYNANGQLADGTLTQRLTPLKIGTASDWKYIFANDVTSFAIKNNGTLWGWGYLHYGSVNTTSPQQFGSHTDWLAVSSGGQHTLGLKTNGTLWSWGSNDFGERGNGAFSDIHNNTPEQVGSDSDWKTSDAGSRYHITRKNDGTLWAWGSNSNYQLGLYNFNIDQHTPQLINAAGLINLCSPATLADLPVIGTSLKWYDMPRAFGGSIIPSSTQVVNGAHYYATQTVNGCESGDRKEVIVLLGTSTPPTGASAQTLCFTATVADLSAAGTGIVWYSVPSGGTMLDASSPLINGAHYYAAQKIGICESARLDVTVTLTQPASPTGSSAQTFCSGRRVVNLTATGDLILWYSSPTGGSPLDGNDLLVDGNHYYASQTVNGCESPSRFDVTVTVNTTAAPSGSAVQTLCQGSTVASLTATGSEIKWYASSSGGSALATTTSLANNTHYYGSQTINGCESPSRFDVTVSLTTTAAPSGSTAQTFCSGATVANLTATGTTVKWYSSSSGGSALAPETILANGNHYYATQTLSGCESVSRLNVTTTINTTAMPAASATQTFCLTATVASLQATGTALNWYSAATGGSPLAPTVSLINNTHYFVSQTLNSCESARRDVTAVITDVAAPTGDMEQSISADATIADLHAIGSGINWYTSISNAVAGVNKLLLVDLLMPGATYHATQTVDGCESDDVLSVTVLLITGLESDDYELQAYPNPVKDRFRISLSKKIHHLVAVNNLGQSVLTQPVDAREAEIDFSSMASGVYSIQLHLNDRVIVVRVLKQ